MKIASRILSFATSTVLTLGVLPLSVIADNSSQKVRVIVENKTCSTQSGADWEGVLIDEWVEIDNASSVVSIITETAKSKGYSLAFSDWGYVSEINNLSEFDCGSMSGWSLLVNDWFTSDTMDTYTVSSGAISSGDEITFAYTSNYGADLGSLWDNNETILTSLDFSVGKLSESFNSEKTEYMLTLPKDVDSIEVTPIAKNKNFQTRVYKNKYTPDENGSEYKRSEKISVVNGDKIYVGVGNSEWPSMSTAENETVYCINISDGTAEILTAKIEYGEWDLAFSPNQYSYQVIIDDDKNLPKLTFTATSGTTVKLDGEKINSNNNDEYEISLTKSKQKVTVSSSSGTENTYTFSCIEKSEFEQQKITQVENLIDEIGEVNLSSKSKINAARNAYNNLTETQKKLVSNYEILLKAEQAYQSIVNQNSTAIKDIYENTGDFLLKGNVPTVSSVGGEWIIIALARSGRLTDEFENGYYQNLVDYVTQKNSAQLHKSKSTDNSRAILALTAIKKDVTNVAGFNLLEPLSDFDYLKKQGINGPTWALIALDSIDYDIPQTDAKNQTTREKIIDYLLENELPNGGWTLSGNEINFDITGMVLTALAPYYDNENVKSAVARTVDKLSEIQNSNGGFSGSFQETSESLSMIILGLSSIGIDMSNDERFIKNGNSIFDAFKKYNTENGGFKHLIDGLVDQMATEQAYLALSAYTRLASNKPSLFDYSDLYETENPENSSSESSESNIDNSSENSSNLSSVIESDSESNQNSNNDSNNTSTVSSNENSSKTSSNDSVPKTGDVNKTLFVLSALVTLAAFSVAKFKSRKQ